MEPNQQRLRADSWGLYVTHSTHFLYPAAPLFPTLPGLFLHKVSCGEQLRLRTAGRIEVASAPSANRKRKNSNETRKAKSTCLASAIHGGQIDRTMAIM